MRRRPWAAFRTDLPDDGVQNEAGTEFLVQGGRNVAEAIGGLLRDLGCEVEKPRDAGDHGWDFAAHGQGRDCWCQVTSLYPWFFLLFEDERSKGSPIGRGLSEALDAAMRRDGRFHDILWYTRDGGPAYPHDGTGAESPMADVPSGIADDQAGGSGGWIALFVLLGLIFFAAMGVVAIVTKQRV